MNYILHIETSTEFCSVALSNNGQLLSLKMAAEKQLHTTVLSLLIDDIIKENDCVYKDLAAISISEGPGSYTGLRVGYATAKGLCYGLSIPLIEVPTLEVILSGTAKHVAMDHYDCIISCIDARRMEVYAAHYTASKTEIKKKHSWIVDTDELQALTDNYKNILICGHGVNKLKAICADIDQIDIVAHPPSALDMISLSTDIYNQMTFSSVAYAEPAYLKPPNITKSKKVFF